MVAAPLMTLVEESTPPEEYMCNNLKASNPFITQKALPNAISHSCWLHAEETTKLSVVVVLPFVVFAMYIYKYMVLQGMRHAQDSKVDHNI
jgi:hypothetical protein